MVGRCEDGDGGEWDERTGLEGYVLVAYGAGDAGRVRLSPLWDLGGS